MYESGIAVKDLQAFKGSEGLAVFHVGPHIEFCTGIALYERVHKQVIPEILPIIGVYVSFFHFVTFVAENILAIIVIIAVV